MKRMQKSVKTGKEKEKHRHKGIRESEKGGGERKALEKKRRK